MAGIVVAPPGTVSVRVTFAVTAGPSADFVCNFDNLFFSNAGIFVDGFETGDASAWSSSAPQ
ncbi:MAG: hypothetical protein GY856_16515 [bacterium]|nr:hypothetical protein [bacterium]